MNNTYSKLFTDYVDRIETCSWKDVMDISEEIAVDSLDGNLTDSEYEELVDLIENIWG